MGDTRKEKMRILIVDQSAELAGGELSLFEIVKRMPFSIEVLLLSDGPFRTLLENSSIPVSIVPLPQKMAQLRRESGALESMTSIQGLASSFKSVFRKAKDFDVLYANSQKSAFFCAFVAFLQRKPLVWHIRDIADHNHFSSWALRIIGFLGRHFTDRIIAVSKASREALLKLRIDPKKISVIYSGVDPQPFESVLKTKKELRSNLGISDEEFVIGSFSRLAPWKGQSLLIEALTVLPKTRILLAGSALFHEFKFENELTEKILRLGLQDRVQLLGFRGDIPELMTACDVIAHTPLKPEPFGRVLIEGMFAERPVLTARSGGALEIIEDKKTGVFFEPNNIDDLCRKILWLQEDVNRRTEIAMAGKKHAKELFSVIACRDQVKRVLEEVALK